MYVKQWCQWCQSTSRRLRHATLTWWCLWRLNRHWSHDNIGINLCIPRIWTQRVALDSWDPSDKKQKDKKDKGHKGKKKKWQKDNKYMYILWNQKCVSHKSGFWYTLYLCCCKDDKLQWLWFQLTLLWLSTGHLTDFYWLYWQVKFGYSDMKAS